MLIQVSSTGLSLNKTQLVLKYFVIFYKSPLFLSRNFSYKSETAGTAFLCQLSAASKLEDLKCHFERKQQQTMFSHLQFSSLLPPLSLSLHPLIPSFSRSLSEWTVAIKLNLLWFRFGHLVCRSGTDGLAASPTVSDTQTKCQIVNRDLLSPPSQSLWLAGEAAGLLSLPNKGKGSHSTKAQIRIH